MAFATLPHIKTCGHEMSYDTLYEHLVSDGFDDVVLGDTIATLQSHYNCLGLQCSDVGRHVKDSSMHPECSDNLDIAGYTPVNATKTNMVAKLDLDAVAIHQLVSMDKHEIAKKIYVEGHNYYDYDNTEAYNFVSLYNLTQSHTIDYADFSIYQLFDQYYGPDFSHKLFVELFDKTGIFVLTTSAQRDLALHVAVSSIVSYMAALEALYFSAFRCGTDKTSAVSAFDGAVALLIGSVEGRGRGGSPFQEGMMFYSIAKRNCLHFHNCRGGDSEANEELFRVLTEGQNFIKDGDCVSAASSVEQVNSLLKVPLIQSLLYFSDTSVSNHQPNDAAAYVASKAVLPILDNTDNDAAETTKFAFDFQQESNTPESINSDVKSAVTTVFANETFASEIDCASVTNVMSICSGGDDTGQSTLNPDDGALTPPDIDDSNPTTSEENTLPDVIEETNQPLPISNGLYVATNFVGDRSAIARDIQEIENYLSENDFVGANHTYSHGECFSLFLSSSAPRLLISLTSIVFQASTRKCTTRTEYGRGSFDLLLVSARSQAAP